jgi:hypothetical protein
MSILFSVSGREPDVGGGTDPGGRPKFSAPPVWLEEIHNNRIFNKRRNLIMEEQEEEEEGAVEVVTVLEAEPPRENSKTESDQDSHTSV